MKEIKINAEVDIRKLIENYFLGGGGMILS